MSLYESMRFKGTFIILAFLGLSANTSAQDSTEFHPCFFTKKSYLVGAALSLELPHPSPLMNLRGYYNLEKHICFGLEYSNNLSHKENEQEISAVGHYIFDVFSIGVYPLAGFGILRKSNKVQIQGEILFGGKLGIGVHRNVKNMTFFLEYAHGWYKNSIMKNIGSFGLLYEIKSRNKLKTS